MLWKAAENQIRCIRIENVIRYKIAEVIGDISLKKTTGLKFDYYWKKVKWNIESEEEFSLSSI